MKKSPRVTAKELIKVLEKVGFHQSRSSGSHLIYKKESKRVVIPFHSGKIIHPKILKDIISVCEIDLDKFIELL